MKSTRETIRSSPKRGFVLTLLFIAVASHTPTVMAQPSGTFTAAGDMTAARAFHTATLLPNGKVLIAGGRQSFSPPGNVVTLASAQLYDPSNGGFTPTGNMTAPRYYHTATLLPDGRVLIASGGSAELYDPSTGTFTATGDRTRTAGRATLLLDGRVFFGAQPFAETYDPVTGTFDPTGAYAAIRFGDPVTRLANGNVLVGSCDARTELYDPATDTFTLNGRLIGAVGGYRCTYSATLLPDGKVLVAGGDNDFYYPTTVEVYDPSPGTFSETGNMTTGREYHTATLLPDGTVLIAGGGAEGDLVTAELYAPATGAFSPAGKMTTPRVGHTATLLPDGTVLIAGGDTGFQVQTSSAELYRPARLQSAPVLLSLSGDGRGPGAILHAETHQVVSPANPAVPGEVLEVYCTGLMDGSVIPPQVALGGRMAEVLWFGNAPGFAGLNQVNIRVPSGVAPRPAVPVRLTYLDRPSNEVTIGVQ